MTSRPYCLQLCVEGTVLTSETDSLTKYLIAIGAAGFTLAGVVNLVLLGNGFPLRLDTRHVFSSGARHFELYFSQTAITTQGIVTIVTSVLVSLGFIGHWRRYSRSMSLATSFAFLLLFLFAVTWMYYFPPLRLVHGLLSNWLLFEQYWSLGTLVMIFALMLSAPTFASETGSAQWRFRLRTVGLALVGFAWIGFTLYVLIPSIDRVPATICLLGFAYLFAGFYLEETYRTQLSQSPTRHE